MSDDDRARWDARYRAGAYADRSQPSVYVEKLVQPARAAGLALDVACGAGRNSRFLAGLGYRVHAVDIAAEALTRAAAADRTPAAVEWLCADLDNGLPATCATASYDVIVMIRYLDLKLVPLLLDRLAPQGLLLVEVHLQTDEVVAGPESNRFRAAPGALERAVLECPQNVTTIDAFEGLTTDPDGRPVALARRALRAGPG